jgi:hypothetical protein
VEWFEDSSLELYDLEEDSSEKSNLAAQVPARVLELREELRAWQKEVGAKFPARNPGYDPEKPSGRAAERRF